MTAKTHPVCTHPRETFEHERGLSSYRCPECNARVCLDCGRYGAKDFMIDLVSWMTGLCDDCYRDRGARQTIRDHYWREVESRNTFQRIWNEGRDASAGSVNPYAEPTYYEKSLLDMHDWLREEVQS